MEYFLNFEGKKCGKKKEERGKRKEEMLYDFTTLQLSTY